ncbi:TPA: IS4 family transposase [Legionella pneumophila]|nr:IS4 family transposase [Legionella pneumophila]HAT8860329.1 IS4 family transposase [Legionella pneumophila subsp. pneumophila]HAT7074259.1 IS4 family transposase [Legionella pneumophila]HAT8643090.1 IS4 family transposase [Legionella pneumophila]HAT8869601.1 IS4 family transposase [Legionella pneumophila subsp. pneumophila]HAT8891337.1 IS4 family transposase [Legionella pneumophila subsp. pneumophila]
MLKKISAIHQVQEKIVNDHFISNHKVKSEDFTRDRKLTFKSVFIQLFRKTVKSLQLSLNEVFMNGYIPSPVSASAYTQARNKFKHTAFIELNNDIVSIFYSEEESIKRWNGYRCIGVDGSKIILPKSADIANEFGSIPIVGNFVNSSFSCAMFECYYDVLNHIAVDSMLAHGLSYEVDLAIQMLHATNERDLLLYDRAYASYEFLATLTQQGKNYLIRCPYSSFKEVHRFVRDTKCWSKVVALKAPPTQRKKIKDKGLPLEIKVRFVSVILSTGELEILVTSIMDNSIEREEFRWLYGKRWGIETFYSLVKGRLCLENFSGKSLEAVKQDFWSTIFISNFETLMTEGTEEEMNAHLQEHNYKKKINTAVSFNTIKNMAFELFMKGGNPAKTLEKMTLLFKTNPGLERVGREPQKRKKTSDLQSYNFQRRGKKHVF